MAKFEKIALSNIYCLLNLEISNAKMSHKFREKKIGYLIFSFDVFTSDFISKLNFVPKFLIIWKKKNLKKTSSKKHFEIPSNTCQEIK